MKWYAYLYLWVHGRGWIQIASKEGPLATAPKPPYFEGLMYVPKGPPYMYVAIQIGQSEYSRQNW